MGQAKSETEKNILRRMRLQFCAATLTCLAVIAALSVLAFFYKSHLERKNAEIPQDAYTPQEEDLIAQIDGLGIGYIKKELLKELRDACDCLPEKSKKRIGAERLAKLSEAVRLNEALENEEGSFRILDESQNRYHLDFKRSKNAFLKRKDGHLAFAGQAKVAAPGGADALEGLFGGNGSFTVEAVVNPNDKGYYNAAEPNDPDNYNMIVSKGDHCMGLRISEKSLQFFLWNGQQWMNVKVDLTKRQLHSWIHVAGIYDGRNAMVYLEGSGMHTMADVGEVMASDYPFTLGYCPETGRASDASIRSVRVYDRALTEEELDAGDQTPQDAHVALWYDFSRPKYEGMIGEAEGIRAYIPALRLKEGQEEAIAVDPVPYYAAGELVFQTDAPQAVAVSEAGAVTGKQNGAAVVTASLQGTDFSVNIPVQVGDAPMSLAGMVGWATDRIFWIDLALFAFSLFFIAAWQRRQAVRCLARLSGAIGSLGEEKEEVSFPPVLGEAQATLLLAGERFRQKDKTVREAEQRKNELMAYLAHDLKTPIASTIGYLTLLHDEERLSFETRRHYAEIALNNAQRLNELVEEFFEITRFNMSHIELERQEINLTWFLEQMVSEFEPMFAKKGLTCRLCVGHDVRFYCDPDKMERVFDNLIRNAINYSYRDTEICITVSDGDSLTVTCENRGDTISEDKLNRIFEQLYRLDSARSSDTGGSGLGLAIAKQIVELHGGSILAESKDNRICFTVILPRRHT